MLSIFDGHNDLLMRLYLDEGSDQSIFFQRGDRGAIDLPRATEGGFGGGFFAVYLPEELPGSSPPPAETGTVTDEGYDYPLDKPLEFSHAQRTAMNMTAILFRIERESAGGFRVVRRADELSASLRDGVIAAVLHFEGAEAIDPDLNALEVFHRAGLRSLGIVWSRPNIFGHGVPFRFPSSPDTGPGLTDAGKNLVQGCNRLGIMIDLSHLNEQGFWDVARLSDAPLVATHSAVHAISPSTRNLTDRQIDAIGESGGVIGVNFHVRDIRPDGRKIADTPISQLVDHIDYIANRIGIDHVALGSDYDGATVPAPLVDVSRLQSLAEVLAGRGYDRESMEKIAHGNWVSLLRRTWKDDPVI